MPGSSIMPPSERHRLLAATVIFALLAGWHLFSDHGLRRLREVNAELASVRAANAALEGKIRSTAREVGRLEHDDRYFEEYARRTYGLIRKNERILEFKALKERLAKRR